MDNIIFRFKKQAYKQPVYVQILIEEGLTLQLIEYCKQNISQIENLYHHLIDKHYEEVNKLFNKYIKQEAEAAGDRKKYKKVCAKIKTYKKTFGNIQADKIIGELKQAHYRKPAFLDELNRIK